MVTSWLSWCWTGCWGVHGLPSVPIWTWCHWLGVRNPWCVIWNWTGGGYFWLLVLFLQLSTLRSYLAASWGNPWPSRVPLVPSIWVVGPFQTINVDNHSLTLSVYNFKIQRGFSFGNTPWSRPIFPKFGRPTGLDGRAVQIHIVTCLKGSLFSASVIISFLDVMCFSGVLSRHFRCSPEAVQILKPQGVFRFLNFRRQICSEVLGRW
jgi:hypothetical protein